MLFSISLDMNCFCA